MKLLPEQIEPALKNLIPKHREIFGRILLNLAEKYDGFRKQLLYIIKKGVTFGVTHQVLDEEIESSFGHYNFQKQQIIIYSELIKKEKIFERYLHSLLSHEMTHAIDFQWCFKQDVIKSDVMNMLCANHIEIDTQLAKTLFDALNCVTTKPHDLNQKALKDLSKRLHLFNKIITAGVGDQQISKNFHEITHDSNLFGYVNETWPINGSKTTIQAVVYNGKLQSQLGLPVSEGTKQMWHKLTDIEQQTLETLHSMRSQIFTNIQKQDTCKEALMKCVVIEQRYGCIASHLECMDPLHRQVAQFEIGPCLQTGTTTPQFMEDLVERHVYMTDRLLLDQMLKELCPISAEERITQRTVPKPQPPNLTVSLLNIGIYGFIEELTQSFLDSHDISNPAVWKALINGLYMLLLYVTLLFLDDTPENFDIQITLASVMICLNTLNNYINQLSKASPLIATTTTIAATTAFVGGVVQGGFVPTMTTLVTSVGSRGLARFIGNGLWNKEKKNSSVNIEEIVDEKELKLGVP